MSVETLLRVYGHHHADNSAEVHSALRHKRHSFVTDNSERKANKDNDNVVEMAAKSLTA
jgi:hypothetical protein